MVWGGYDLLYISIVSQALNRFTLQIMTDVENYEGLHSLGIVIGCTLHLLS